MMKVSTYLMSVFARLRDERDGLALTEYLILLGLLTAAVITAVIAFGDQLGTLWQAWADWLNGLNGPPS